MSDDSHIKINFNGLLGNFWHYGRFILDFIIPVVFYINTKNANVKKIYVINKHFAGSTGVYRTTLGTFNSVGQQILGVEITNIDEKEMPELPTINLDCKGHGPYSENDCKYILPQYIKNNTILESNFDVLLIERGFKVLVNGNTSTGIKRRFLKNHKKIKEELSNKYGEKFKNVILEETSIQEQVSLFYNAKIIIGQHGAGLANILFMSDKAELVIELPPYLTPTFSKLCAIKKIKYVRCDEDKIFNYL